MVLADELDRLIGALEAAGLDYALKARAGRPQDVYDIERLQDIDR